VWQSVGGSAMSHLPTGRRCDKITVAIYCDDLGPKRRLCAYHLAKFQERIPDPMLYIDASVVAGTRWATLPCQYEMVEHEVADWEAAHCTLPLWAFG
jgi:hypothetical protein